MKRIYLFLITLILSLTLSVSTVSASNGNEIIPFHPDPSLVTEWNVSEQGYNIVEVFIDTPILKIILPDGIEDIQLTFSEIYRDIILWILPPVNDFPVFLEMVLTDVFSSTLWLGGRQSIEPSLYLSYFSMDEYSQIKNIYLYPDTYIDVLYINTFDSIDLYSYNFEYELSQEYQLGYDEGYDNGWGEKNKMTDITFLIIGLIIFIIANVLGFIYKNNLLTALSGLLWLLPIFLVDNVFIKIFSVIIMIITFLFSFRERSDYYV